MKQQDHLWWRQAVDSARTARHRVAAWIRLGGPGKVDCWGPEAANLEGSVRRSPQSGPVCQPHSTQDPTPDGCRPSSTEVWLAAVTCTRASPRAAVSQPEASVIITSQIGGGGEIARCGACTARCWHRCLSRFIGAVTDQGSAGEQCWTP
ncbi:hypothetical protein ACCO45_004845 [Purpureocillium lilacinum]|uniref:Uncharacterized protein n=1 Tax=Purpureocillium lilacinum TaxID=33203 RepID=A0ACC4DUF0_PURLI